MSTNKKIKTDNKIFQDIIDFEILQSIINYLFTSKKNKTNNWNNNTINQYKINKFYFYRNEILNYILVSKKWYNFISLTISNNIIDNKSLFEHWLKTNYDNNNNKSFFENYNNQNQFKKNKNNDTLNYRYQYFRNKTVFKKDNKQNKISFNKEFSIIKIQESIINDYFKFNLFLDQITIDDFKEIKNKFENNQLPYNRIVVNGETRNIGHWDSILFKIHKYISNENSEIVSNLFKILELNYDFLFNGGYCPDSEEEEICTELNLNNLSITGYIEGIDYDDDDGETVKIFKIFKGKNIIYDGSDEDENYRTHVNYSALFDPDNSGQQVESIKVLSQTFGNEEFVEPLHLVKVNQFQNLHSIAIPINSLLILSDISEEIKFYGFYERLVNSGNSKNMKSELNQMINSFITSKSLKNLKITSVNFKHYPFEYEAYARYDNYFKDDNDLVIFANKLNGTLEYFSNCFKPLFSELNTSIERIELDCMGLLNTNTFSNLLNNKSIKYLYLYESDFIVYSSKQNDGSAELHGEPISINQYLFENIFTSPLTSIRHYKINFKDSNELKLIFKLILNNIFKLQLYSLIFDFNEFNAYSLLWEFVKEFKDFINNITTQQKQQQKSNNINLKEIKIKINNGDRNNYDEHIKELNNTNNPYFTTVIKRIEK
ncbi:hypothetical protein ACTFIY_008774 [Dictyostelium cf. discoideum]